MMTHPDPDRDEQQLQQALQQHSLNEQRLNRITIVFSIILALIVSVISANANLYSLMATFIAALVFFTLASIFRRSLVLLLPLIILFCLADNYLSHTGGFNHPHFLLQLIPLTVFTAIFGISRPYLMQWMGQHPFH